MDMMELRRRVVEYDAVMQGNLFNFIDISATNYISVSTGYNRIVIQKTSSTAQYYGRTKSNLSNFNLISGKKYRLTATIKGFSRSNLTGFIFIADANSQIAAQTTQLNTLSIGDSLSMEFIYNPNTMVELSFYMNRDFNVPSGTYIVYGDVLLLETT